MRVIVPVHGPHGVRGYWLTGLGQRVEEWVPEGTYDMGDAAVVNGVAVVALCGANGWAWHVPLSIASKLRKAVEPCTAS